MKKTSPAARARGRPPVDAAHAVPESRALALAFRSFARDGYEGTTLRSLARQLGVSHNLLNVRFGTKAELWKRAIGMQITAASAPLYAAFEDPALSDEARLRVLIERFCGWAFENPELVGVAFTEGRHASWRLDYIADAYLIPFKTRLEDLLSRIAAERPLRPISVTALMSLLVNGIGFYFTSLPLMERIGVADEMRAPYRQKQVESLADFLLAALLPDDRR